MIKLPLRHNQWRSYSRAFGANAPAKIINLPLKILFFYKFCPKKLKKIEICPTNFVTLATPLGTILCTIIIFKI
jgi:hypothetical protein